MTKRRAILIVLAVLIVGLFVAAATTITGLTEVVNLADGDILVVVDISDTAQSANGSTRKVTAENLGDYIQSMWSTETAQFSGMGIGEAGVAAQINSNAALTIDLDDQDLTVDCGTDKTLVLNTPVYCNVPVVMYDTDFGTVASPDEAQWLDNGGGSTGIYLQWFDDSTDEELFFMAEVPHGYKEASDITFSVTWTPETTADGTPASQEVEWGLEYTWLDPGDTGSTTSIIYEDDHTPADANVTADKVYTTTFSPDVTGTGMEIGSILVGRLFRNADGGNDTYEHDAGLLHADITCQIDTIGSRQAASK